MAESLFPKAYADAVARLRVPSGFLLVLAFAWLSRPSARSISMGVPVSLAGLWLRGWAAGHLSKNRELALSGPYAWVRNPLYIGTLLVAAGLALASRRWELGLLFTAIFLLVYLPVIELEEQHLRHLFPEYGEYAQRVPALIPTRRAKGHAARFQWGLYFKNQEYQALAGFVLGVAWLAGRVWLGTNRGP